MMALRLLLVSALAGSALSFVPSLPTPSILAGSAVSSPPPSNSSVCDSVLRRISDKISTQDRPARLKTTSALWRVVSVYCWSLTRFRTPHQPEPNGLSADTESLTGTLKTWAWPCGRADASASGTDPALEALIAMQDVWKGVLLPGLCSTSTRSAPNPRPRPHPTPGSSV